jgi:hypothetical protein
MQQYVVTDFTKNPNRNVYTYPKDDWLLKSTKNTKMKTGKCEIFVEYIYHHVYFTS